MIFISAPSHANSWQFDTKKTNINFTLTLFNSVKKVGKFTKFSGKVNYNNTEPAKNSMHMKVATNSLVINLPEQLAALGNSKLFNHKKHPYMTFYTDRMVFLPSKSKHKRMLAIGKLSFMGKKRLAKFQVTYRELKNKQQQTKRIMFYATTTIKRSNYGVKLPVLSGVSDDIDIKVTGVLTPSQK